MNAGPTMSASKLISAIPGATMVTPSISTPVTTTVTSLNNAPRTALSERGDSKFLCRVRNITIMNLSVFCRRQRILVKAQRNMVSKYLQNESSTPQEFLEDLCVCKFIPFFWRLINIRNASYTHRVLENVLFYFAGATTISHRTEEEILSQTTTSS